MDLHSFRIIAGELIRLLAGARLEKIHAPEPGLYAFSFFARGLKLKLLFQYERKMPLLFFTRRRLENPLRPPARVMRLRKYCAGRKLGEGIADPAARSLAFPVRAPHGASQGEGQAVRGVYLVLDMVNGADIVEELPASFGRSLTWPDAKLVDALCRNAPDGRETHEPWREYAVLTPLLRETLSCLEPPEGRALLVDLEAGQGDLFFYASEQGRTSFYAAWPLPLQVMKRRSLSPCDPEATPPRAEPDHAESREGSWRESAGAFQREFPALYGVSLVDEERFFSGFGKRRQKEEQAPEKRQAKRLARLMAKLEQEKTRLSGMFALHEKARQIQAVLWQYPADAKLARVEIPGQSGAVELDPRLTIRENMAYMFHQAARGKRGLAMLEQRMATLAESGGATGTRGNLPQKQADRPGGSEPSDGQTGARPLPSSDDRREYKDVARFLSSDGLILLRGKNARGNLGLLRLGKGHDLWLHVEGEPGAHVIIRRAHEGEDVPRTTLREAALLATEKSRRHGEAGVGVMMALLRHVHPVKGAAPGTVRVDTLIRTLVPDRDCPEQQQDERDG